MEKSEQCQTSHREKRNFWNDETVWRRYFWSENRKKFQIWYQQSRDVDDLLSSLEIVLKENAQINESQNNDRKKQVKKRY